MAAARKTPKPSASAPLAAQARSLSSMRAIAAGCTACPLFARATQTVFGEGPARAPLVLVGEQPGDEEDVSGRPFVGPAERYLDGALAAAGIDRADVYLTNAVKHFKWTPAPRGKKRIHSKPLRSEIDACRGWLEGELRSIRPRMILCLGATAAQAFMGSRFSVTARRGEIVEGTPWAPLWMATWHPSALLRMPDEASRHRAKAELAEDLEKAARALRAARA
jgi:DNA polymerase